MTREILNKVAKAKNVNLEWYDNLLAIIDESHTNVIIIFANLEVVGRTNRFFCNKKVITISVSDIQKREESEWDYTTQGWERIENIR